MLNNLLQTLGFRQIPVFFYTRKVMQGLRPPECHWMLGCGIIDYGFGEGWWGTTSTSPRNAANLSRFLLVGHCEDWRRALHWQADEDTCLLPASPLPGLHGTALASLKAPENRQPAPGNAACHLITHKKTIL